MAKPQKFRDKWRIQWLDETGKRQGAVLKSYSAAERKLRLEQVRVEEIRQGLRRPNSDKTYKDAALAWLETYAKWKKRSWKDDETRLRLHAIPFLGDRTLDRIDDKVIDEYVRHLKQKLSTGSNHKKPRPFAFQTLQNIVNVSLKVLRDAGFPLRAKLRRVAEVDAPLRYIRTQAEVARVIAACDPEWFQVLVSTAVYTGMRRGELVGLRWTDIDFANGWIAVERSYDGPTKSGRNRRVPIAAELEPTLKRWRLRTPGVLVFPDPAKGGLMSRKAALGSRLRTACRHAGVNVVRVHDLRHTYASHYMMAGGDLYRLQGYLGHSDAELTQRYAHLRPDHLVAVDRGRLSFKAPAGAVAALHTPPKGDAAGLHTGCTQPTEDLPSKAVST